LPAAPSGPRHRRRTDRPSSRSARSAIRDASSLYAATQPGIHRRAGSLRRALAAAAETDPELRALQDELETLRLVGMGRFMGLLAERGALRPGMSVEQARDIAWTLCSAPVHDMLVIERGWTSDEYRDWLADVLKRELLGDVH
jgi:hypothetical protein